MQINQWPFIILRRWLVHFDGSLPSPVCAVSKSDYSFVFFPRQNIMQLMSFVRRPYTNQNKGLTTSNKNLSCTQRWVWPTTAEELTFNVMQLMSFVRRPNTNQNKGLTTSNNNLSCTQRWAWPARAEELTFSCLLGHLHVLLGPFMSKQCMMLSWYTEEEEQLNGTSGRQLPLLWAKCN